MRRLTNPNFWLGFTAGSLIMAGIMGHAGAYQIVVGVLALVMGTIGIVLRSQPRPGQA
jgi:hypothetical protein